MTRKEDYIAVFDSGVGGISVLKELVKAMPGEKYLYFGDSANAPYGQRPTEEVRALTLAAAEQLMARGVKALVIACNTATAAAINDLRNAYPDTIIIGIEPALKVAADRFPGGHIGVMATPVTLREEKFSQQLHRFPNVQVTPIPVTGLVELIEEGAAETRIDQVLRQCLGPYAGKLDAVVLGCTHYPFATAQIQNILGTETVLLDGNTGTAAQTRRLLEKAGLLLEETGSITIENSSADPAIVRRCEALLQEIQKGSHKL